MRTRAKTTPDFVPHSPSPRPSPIGYVLSVGFTSVAAAILPAVEGGILPPLPEVRNGSDFSNHTPFPPGRMPGSTAGRMPAATLNTYAIGWERENCLPPVGVSNRFGSCERRVWLFPLPSDGRVRVRVVLFEIRLLSGNCFCTNHEWLKAMQTTV